MNWACLQHYLIEQHRAGIAPVLFVDEAQDLKSPLFEVLRQLLNYETNTQKLLQIVLLGQTELVLKLERIPALKRSGQYLRCSLQPDPRRHRLLD